MSRPADNGNGRVARSGRPVWDEQEAGAFSNRDANFVERESGALDGSAPGWTGTGAPEALTAGQEILGQIRELDAALHTVTFTDGTVYAIDEQFNMGGFTAGEWVRLTAGAYGVIREMTPQAKQ
jgi:hypothetical protein